VRVRKLGEIDGAMAHELRDGVAPELVLRREGIASDRCEPAGVDGAIVGAKVGCILHEALR